MLNRVINCAYHWIMDLDQEGLVEELNSISLPVWDDMTNLEKVQNICYVNENREIEDFGHSELCAREHQATAAFMVEWFRSQDLLEILFDDLDFMM